jgi:hypothetical protein
VSTAGDASSVTFVSDRSDRPSSGNRPRGCPAGLRLFAPPRAELRPLPAMLQLDTSLLCIHSHGHLLEIVIDTLMR